MFCNRSKFTRKWKVNFKDRAFYSFPEKQQNTFTFLKEGCACKLCFNTFRNVWLSLRLRKKGIFFDPSAAKGWSKVFFGLGCFDKSAAAFCNNFLVVDLLIFGLFVVSSFFSVLQSKNNFWWMVCSSLKLAFIFK